MSQALSPSGLTDPQMPQRLKHFGGLIAVNNVGFDVLSW